MSRRRHVVQLVGLMAYVAMLCAWLWFELTRDLTRQAAGPAAQPGVAQTLRGEVRWTAIADVDDYAEAHSAQAYADMVERPLFLEGRRPVAPQVAEPAPAPPPRPVRVPDWRLVGVVIVEGQPRAVLWDEREGRFLRLHEGDVVNGWTAVEVGAQRLIIENTGQRHVLALRRY